MKRLIFLLFLLFLFSGTLLAQGLPRERGVYVKLENGFKRLLPNIVFEEEGIYFIEMLRPIRIPLKEIEYFFIRGDYNMEVLTLNPMVFWQKSPLGKDRFMFGKELELEIKKIDKNGYMVKQKGLLGRGYFSLWIDNTAWDFIIE